MAERGLDNCAVLAVSSGKFVFPVLALADEGLVEDQVGEVAANAVNGVGLTIETMVQDRKKGLDILGGTFDGDGRVVGKKPVFLVARGDKGLREFLRTGT